MADEIIENKHEYCGYLGYKDRLGGFLWAYADGNLDEDTEDKLWEHFKNCLYCLTELTNIQKALRIAEEEPGYGYEDLKRILKEKINLF